MTTVVLRRSVTRSKFLARLNSSVPDNAPKASDNESWLQKLAETHTKSVKPENMNDAEDPSFQKPNVTQNFNAKDKYEIISKPPTTPYIGVRAPLSEFVTISHLQSNHQRHAQAKKFVDVRVLKCRSGSGGNGAVSFFRDAGRSIGPPDGGDGGDGGGVYVQAVEGLNSLAKLKTSYIAGDGESGASRQLDGARGKDILISVPAGTIVKWCMNPAVVRGIVEKGLREEKGTLRGLLEKLKVNLQCTGRFEMDQKPTHIQLFRDSYEPGLGWHFKGKDEQYHREKDWFQDLNEKVKSYDIETTEGELSADRFPLYGIDLDKPSPRPICLVKGGKGGLGNMHFLTNIIRNPRFAKVGRSGLEQFFMFELKSLADLGLVGLPNAGKSTILNRISNARPRIGHWEFTTTHPSVGTVNMGIEGQSFTVADIPGIIEGASQDKGMGLEFLRHIQRSKGWVIIVGLDKADPLSDLNLLIAELGGVQEVARKNVLVVCNKADLDPENPASLQKYLNIKSFCDRHKWDTLPLSALKGDNIDILIHKMAQCAGKIL